LQQDATRKGKATRWLVSYPKALPAGLFALIAAITALSVWAMERGEAQRLDAELNARTEAIASALERRANSNSAYLRAGAALLATMEDVPSEEFRRFVSELRLDENSRGSDGFGWAKVVRPSQMDDFNARMAQDIGEDHQLYPVPDGSQPISVPVTFLEPDSIRNRRAIGFDMYSEPVRRAAMIEAERSELPTASDLVVLQQEGAAEAPGFLIYMPVFERGARGRQLKGFIYSPFNAADFLGSALQLVEDGAFGVQLFDGGVDTPGQLLASTLDADGDGLHTSRAMVNIANNRTLLVVSRPQQALLSGLSIATLVFGLLVAGLLAIVIRMLTQQAVEDEASLAWFEEQASIRNSLTRELNHRVKNTLANVLSIIALTRRRAQDVKGFADGLDGRIRALSATHDLLTNSEWGATPISEVIKAELLPYANSEDHELLIKGPEVELAPNDALSLGLAMHELATNAAKYGALSKPGGKLSIVWKLASDQMVTLKWQESGGPPVRQQRQRGFGTDLIERIVAHELRNPVHLEFARKGVECVLHIPVREAREFSLRADHPAQAAQLPRKARVALRVEQTIRRASND